MGVAPNSPEMRQAVEANLFPAARLAVEPWERFPWHGPDTAHEHASQALTIDVFGTIKQSSHRDAILDHLAASLGLPTGGEWKVELESSDKNNWLKETPGLTSIDADLRSPRAVIFCECKFTEWDGAKCSQREPLRRKNGQSFIQCNGHYALQINPANNREAQCALTAKAIRYWDVIPQIFDYAADVDHQPCPFAGAWFQWMRNVTNAYEVAQRTGRQCTFILAYADGPGLPVSRRVKSQDWANFLSHLRPEAITCAAVSVQSIVKLASEAAPADPIWPELAAWVERKITNVCQIRRVKQMNLRKRSKSNP